MNVLSVESEIAVLLSHFNVVLFLYRPRMLRSRIQLSIFVVSQPCLSYYQGCDLFSSGFVYKIIMSCRIQQNHVTVGLTVRPI